MSERAHEKKNERMNAPGLGSLTPSLPSGTLRNRGPAAAPAATAAHMPLLPHEADDDEAAAEEAEEERAAAGAAARVADAAAARTNATAAEEAKGDRPAGELLQQMEDGRSAVRESKRRATERVAAG